MQFQRFGQSGLSAAKPGPGEILLLSSRNTWLFFSHPHAVVQARSLPEIAGAFRRIEAYAQAGFHVAGFVRYEAAPAFDSHLRTLSATGDYLWFGVYAEPQEWNRDVLVPPQCQAARSPLFYPLLEFARYQQSFAAIQDRIRAGDCYQVNFTFPLRGLYLNDPWDYFIRHFALLPSGYLAYMDTGAQQVLSASPELFFERQGDLLRCRPMKGTRPRGESAFEDTQLRNDLACHPKDQAENLMIVDMIRNDLGRIAEPGSVTVPNLLSVEEYPTVWQMTSTVEARSNAGLSDLMSALFPCASITGAPKDASMRIIAELEKTPRQLYTGCLGYLAPHNVARFSVAIRTVQIQAGEATYFVGSGLVADSDVKNEYDECLHKARVLGSVQPEFQLLETLLQLPNGEIWWADLHRERLERSAEYFGYVFSQAAFKEALSAVPADNAFARLRLLLEPSGALRLERFPLPADPRDPPLPWRVKLDSQAMVERPCWSRHKTTVRTHYDSALLRHPGFDDVLLYDEQGYLTESCKANVVIQDAKGLWTPPASQDLLSGVFREHLLRMGVVRERMIKVEELPHVRQLWLVNSLRGWIATV